MQDLTLYMCNETNIRAGIYVISFCKSKNIIRSFIKNKNIKDQLSHIKLRIQLLVHLEILLITINETTIKI